MSQIPGAVDFAALADTVGHPDRERFDVQAWRPPPSVRTALDLPESLWVVSDPRPALGALPADHVMGVGGASLSLATITPREAVTTALDLGSGSGIQSLLLGYHADRVVAIDVNPRALWCTALTCALNGRPIPELVLGSWLEPFGAGEFDLVVADPPFVMAPARRHVYRDSSDPGDALTGRLVAEIARVLRPGGSMVMLTSWLVPAQADWSARVLDWAGSDWQTFWAAQREEVPPSEYVDLWLLDSGEDDDAELRQRWLGHLADLGAAAVGFGWLVGVKASTPRQPAMWAEEVVSARELPDGRQVAAELARRQALPAAAQVLGGTVRLAAGVHLTAIDVAGHDPAADALLLSSEASWRGPLPLDPAMSWLASRVSADLGGTLAEELPLCAEDTGWDVADVVVSWLSGVRDLLGAGFATLDGRTDPARQ
ncbi:MAG: methyltransferase [Candidatus Nanopelagicales bacterium]